MVPRQNWSPRTIRGCRIWSPLAVLGPPLLFSNNGFIILSFGLCCVVVPFVCCTARPTLIMFSLTTERNRCTVIDKALPTQPTACGPRHQLLDLSTWGMRVIYQPSWRTHWSYSFSHGEKGSLVGAGCRRLVCRDPRCGLMSGVCFF